MLLRCYESFNKFILWESEKDVSIFQETNTSLMFSSLIPLQRTFYNVVKKRRHFREEHWRWPFWTVWTAWPVKRTKMKHQRYFLLYTCVFTFIISIFDINFFNVLFFVSFFLWLILNISKVLFVCLFVCRSAKFIFIFFFFDSSCTESATQVTYINSSPLMQYVFRFFFAQGGHH